MARRSTTKFATICLALSAEESIEVPIYYRKEGDEQLGYFVTKQEQLQTSKGRDVFIRECKDQAPHSLRDRIRESLERELEPRVTFERTITRNDSFELPSLESVINSSGHTSDLKQRNNVFSAEYLGKHYSFVRPGTYPVSEGAQTPEVQQPQEQNQSSFDAILNTYKTS